MNDIRLCNKGNTIDGVISITFFHYYLKKTGRKNGKKNLFRTSNKPSSAK